MSSRNITNYASLCRVIETCGEHGVSRIKLGGDIEIEFGNSPVTIGETMYGTDDASQSIDLSSLVSDNEVTVEDTTLSDEIASDAIEDLMLSDPLLYEESVAGIANDKNK